MLPGNNGPNHIVAKIHYFIAFRANNVNAKVG